MSINVALFCELGFYTLAGALADYISAQAQMIEAKAEAMKIQNELKRLEREKGEITHGN